MRSRRPRRDRRGAPDDRSDARHRRTTRRSGRRPVGADPHRRRSTSSGSGRAGERRPDVVPRQVPGVRAHAHQRRDGRPVQRAAARGARPSRPAPGAARASPPAAPPCPGRPAAGPSGPTSSRRWSAAGVTTTRRPSSASTRAISGPLRGANTTSTRSTARVRDRQPGPRVGDDGDRARVRAGGAAGGVRGRVEHHAHRVGQPVEDAGEVVAGAAARGRAASAAARRRRPRPARRVMPA